MRHGVFGVDSEVEGRSEEVVAAGMGRLAKAETTGSVLSSWTRFRSAH